LLFYDFFPQQRAIQIHIAPTIVENPIELRNLFVNGLKKLAEEIKNDKENNEVEIISGHSWIINQHPDLVKRLGFEISETDTSYAQISREKFLKLYG